MKDSFALFNEPRRPWLEPEALKQKFLALSAQLHPDRVHGAGEAQKKEAQERYAELNAAYNRLRDPKERLSHLLELELGARPQDVQRIPDGLISLFSEINQSCRETDALLAEKDKVTSPLLKVQIFDRAQEQSQKMSALQQRVNSQREHLLADLQAIDRDWGLRLQESSLARNSSLQRLEEIYRLLSYFTRWMTQLQERIVQLAM